MSTRKPLRVDEHNLGGTIEFYKLTNGRYASVLDATAKAKVEHVDGEPVIDENGYEVPAAGSGFLYGDDFEIHERVDIGGESFGVVPGTERHANSRGEVEKYLDELEAREPVA